MNHHQDSDEEHAIDEALRRTATDGYHRYVYLWGLADDEWKIETEQPENSQLQEFAYYLVTRSLQVFDVRLTHTLVREGTRVAGT